MERVKLIISYDGRNYCGFQDQKNSSSIQTQLEMAVKAVYGENIKITASGRTDAGVSARGQVVHFDCDGRVSTDKIPFALNRYLPEDISVREAEVMPDNFNARFSAKRKTYIYRIYNKNTKDPLELFCAFFPKNLDADKMREGAKYLLGTHDFRAFMASGSSVKNTTRTIYRADVNKENDIVEIILCGSGFLYNMVRIIAGTLVNVGTGKIKPKEIADIINSKDRKNSGKTMPSAGLCLERVEY